MSVTNKVYHLLLIDDNSTDNEFHQLIIGQCDIETRIDSISSSRMALEYFRKCLDAENPADHPLPDLIFLDINMPAINGFELLERLRKLPDTYHRRRHIKIFMLSGSINPDDQALIATQYRDMVLGYYIKPLTDTLFIELLQKHF